MAGLPSVGPPSGITPALATVSTIFRPAASSVPNAVYAGVRPDASPYTMKNWLPLVLGPEFAIASTPRPYLSSGYTSSLKL